MKEEKIQRIEHRLKQAYHNQPHFKLSGKWQQDTMRRIRQLGPLAGELNFLSLFEQLVWRMAPVTGLLVVVMGSLIAHFGWISETSLVDLLLNESQAALSILYIIGVG